MAFVDVFIIGLGFVARVLAGTFAAAVTPTIWIVICTFLLAILLGFSKRRTELATLAGSLRTEQRPVLAAYSLPMLDRGLRITAGITVLIYALFATLAHGNLWWWITVLPVAAGLWRYLQLIARENTGRSPELFLFSDRWLQGTILIWVVLCFVVRYQPGLFHG